METEMLSGPCYSGIRVCHQGMLLVTKPGLTSQLPDGDLLTTDCSPLPGAKAADYPGSTRDACWLLGVPYSLSRFCLGSWRPHMYPIS